MNWEIFLDDYIGAVNPIVEKKVYETIKTITYTKKDIYINCELDLDKQLIQKLEFGRAISSELSHYNLIKAVLRNDKKENIQFIQTSFLGESGKEYHLEWNDINKQIVKQFLKIPMEIGWIEYEYLLNKFNLYKITVQIDSLSLTNTITIFDFSEQDIPLLGDKLEQWIRVKMADAFWNNNKRTINKIKIIPINN